MPRTTCVSGNTPVSYAITRLRLPDEHSTGVKPIELGLLRCASSLGHASASRPLPQRLHVWAATPRTSTKTVARSSTYPFDYFGQTENNRAYLEAGHRLARSLDSEANR